MHLPRLYTEIPDWWPVLSAPESYEEESRIFRHAFEAMSHVPIETLLELGSGGGHTASWLKAFWRLTLVDVAPGMLEVSRGLNPECEHVHGDMRDVRLERFFDAVLIHDAIAYMTTEGDLKAALATAFVHLKPGGVALFVPDDTEESYHESTKHGGYDVGDRAMRYLEWNHDPDPGDTTTTSTMVYVLKEEGRTIRVLEDEHVLGLFPQETWMRLLAEVGFIPSTLPFRHSELPEDTCEIFVGAKPA